MEGDSRVRGAAAARETGGGEEEEEEAEERRGGGEDEAPVAAGRATAGGEARPSNTASGEAVPSKVNWHAMGCNFEGSAVEGVERASWLSGADTARTQLVHMDLEALFLS